MTPNTVTPWMCILLVLALQACSAPGFANFDKSFTGRTLRLEYEHGNFPRNFKVQREKFQDPHPTAESGAESPVPEIQGLNPRIESSWAGSRTQLIDSSDFGKYIVEVRDLASLRLLYSRGFCSIFGEWETTGEAKKTYSTFEESVRVPEPRLPFRFTIQKRAEDGSFLELFTRDIDLTEYRVDRAAPESGAEIITVFENGDPASHVDLLIASDGYAKEQRGKFIADTKRLVDVMFQTEPYRRRESDFNVRALFVPSPQAGISNPRKEVVRQNTLGLTYNSFGSDRYVLTMKDRELRKICAQAPYDALILLFNERKYGGGGIYNLWATVAADTEPAAYIFVHEFGHSFAGLADEYYTSQVAYEDLIKPGIEPWEPNVTALLDPTKLKWKDLVAKDTPLPTPWGQQHFDEVDLAYQKRRAEMIDAKASEAEMEALFREVKGQTGPLLANEKFAGLVGAFEGASYQAKGLYRPQADCIMFTRNPSSFCKVCERAIERTIDSYVR